MSNDQSRRMFLVNSSKLLATFISVITIGKSISYSQTINTASKPIYKKNSDHKILVAYESHFGSTAEVAKFIGNQLTSDSSKIDIKRISEVDDLSSYAKIIIGSAIQYDKWMPEARAFVISNRKILAQLPVAFFFNCLALSKKTDKTEKKANLYSEKLYALAPEVNPISIGRFAGVLNYAKMSLGSRVFAKGLFAIIGVKEGDYRDWNAIGDWSKSLNF